MPVGMYMIIAIICMFIGVFSVADILAYKRITIFSLLGCILGFFISIPVLILYGLERLVTKYNKNLIQW
jgi:hypothetical protein